MTGWVVSGHVAVILQSFDGQFILRCQLIAENL